MLRTKNITKSIETFLQDTEHKLSTEEIEQLQFIKHNIEAAFDESQILETIMDLLKFIALIKGFYDN